MKAKSGKGRPLQDTCLCDKLDCASSWVCRRIATYQATYKFLEECDTEEFRQHVGIDVRDLMKYVEGEWEILLK